MKTRHRAREVALQVLYRMEMESPGSTPQELLRDLNQHFDHFQVPKEIREFSAELVAGTLRDRATLDPLIESHAAHWKLGRMAMVDRSLLRMAVFEMMHFPETAPSIIIDEAIELAKQYGTEDTPAFVNGVLDAIRQSVIKPA